MKVKKNVSRFLSFLLALVLMFTTFTSDLMVVTAEGRDDVSGDNIVAEAVTESVVDETDAVDDVTGDDLIFDSGAEDISEEEALATGENEFKNIEDENTQDISYPEVYFAPVTVCDTTITIYAPEGAFPEGVTVEISDATDEIDESFEGEDFFAVDISFFDKDNNKIEPLCDISVSIESTSLVTESVDVYHVDEISNEIEFVETAVVEDGAIEFVNDDFSVYVIKKNGMSNHFYFTNDEGLPCAYIFGKNNNVDTSKKSFDNWDWNESNPFYPISGNLGLDHERNIKMYTHDNGFNGGNRSLIEKYEILKKGSTDEVEYTFTDENLCLYYYSQSRYYKKVTKLEYSENNGTGYLTATLYDGSTRDYIKNFSKFCWIVDDAVSEKIVTYKDPTDSFEEIEVPVSSNDANEYKLAACPETWKKTGYTFGGWVCSADQKVYKAGDSYTVNAEVTFTAQWVPIHYYLHYVANGGLGEEIEFGLIAYDEMIDLLSAADVEFSKDGYTLSCWSDWRGETYRLGAQNVVLNLTTTDYNGSEDSTNTAERLYAEWTPTEYSLFFFNEKKEPLSEYSKTYTVESPDFTYTPSQSPEKEGYIFVGWKEITEGVDNAVPVEEISVKKGSFGNRSFIAVFEKEIKALKADIKDIDAYWLGENLSIIEPEVKDADTDEVVKCEFEYFDGDKKVENIFGVTDNKTITVKVSADGYETLVKDVNVDIYYFVPETYPTGVLFDAKQSVVYGNNWYSGFDGENINLKFEGGYKVSKTDKVEFLDNISISATNGEHSYAVYLMKLDKNGDNFGIVGTERYGKDYKATGVYFIDTQAPSADIKISSGRSIIKETLNELTFGLFFKNKVDAYISASDNKNGSGLESVSYLTSQSLVDVNGNLDWISSKSGEKISLPAEFKGLVYVKAIDNAGNTTIVYTDGIVVYKEIKGISKAETYTKTTETDVEIKGEAFGNTVNSVVVVEKNNPQATHVVSFTTPQYDNEKKENYILKLKHEDLEKLNVGSYTVIVTFNCLDENNANNNQKAIIELTVKKAETEAALSIGDVNDEYSWVYDKYNAETNKVTATVVNKDNRNAIVTTAPSYSYKKKGADDVTYKAIDITKLNDVIPGEYTLKVSYGATESLEASSATEDFKVATPEVFYYVRRGSGWGASWTLMDSVKENVLSADVFNNSVFTLDKPIENNISADLKEKFEEASGVISDLINNGYGVSIHKIGLFDKTNNDVNHANSSKHFHVDFDLSKITDNNVSVTMDSWTYGDQRKTPVAKQSTTEPNTDTPKRDGEQNVTFYYTGTLRGEPGAEYASVNAPTQAGTYKVIATFEANDYYNKTTAEAEFTIAPKIVKVDWMLDGKKNTSSVVYDGKAHSVKGEVTNEAYWGENYFVNPIWFENNKTAAGSYTSKAWEVVDRNGIRTYNYTFADTEKFDWTITQKELTISWNGNKAPTYNGTAHRFEATLNDIVNGDDVKPVYNTEAHFGGYPYMTEAVNAGNYTASVCGLTGKDAGNYKIKPYTNTWCNWEIKKAPLTIEWPKNNSLVYDGTLQTYKAILSGIWGSDKVNPVYQNENVWRGYLRCLTESVNCARYIAEVVGVDNPNYTIDRVNNKTHEWEVTQRPLTINWSGKDEWNHSDWNFNFKYSEFPYTISCEFGNVANADRGKITPILAGNLKETNVGNYTAKVTGINGELAYNYKLPRNTVRNWSISYINAWDAVAVPFANRDGWNNTWVSLSEFGYKIRKTSEDGKQTWAPALVLTGETGEGVVEYRLQDTTGYITDVKTFDYKIDYTKPTADVTINDDSILTQVFRWFKKDSAVVKITAEDNLSGVKSIEWKFVGDKEYSDYNDLTGIVVDANKVADIRVKVTDCADNVFKCTSDNIVVYTDAEALTQFVDYYRLSVEDKEIKVNLNENTINEVTGNGITPEDYTIGEDGTITINGEFLETLPGRAVPATDEDGLYTSYIFNVSYNPLGIRFVVEPEEEFIADEENPITEDVVYTEDNRQVVRLLDEVKEKELAPEVYEKEFAFEEDIFARGDEPATTSFEVRVYKNANTGSFTVTDKVYDQTAATYTYSIANELVEGTPVSVLYANAGSDTWTAAAPTGAGSYTAKLVVSEDANYYGFELTDDYTIARRPASIGVFDETKTVGDSDPEWRYDFTGFLPGDSDLAWGWRDSGETAGTYTIHPNVQHVNPNYDITSINGTLTIEEAPAVVLAAPLGGGGGAAITTVANVEEEVAEIPEEEVPEVEAPEIEEVEEEVPAVVEIPEEEVPEAVAERCVIHWLVLADALLYAMYSIFRVLQNKEELSDDAESVEN